MSDRDMYDRAAALTNNVPVSERTAVLRERAAAKWGHAHADHCFARCVEQQYPLPRVTRPRVLQINPQGDEYRVVDGVLQTRAIGRNGNWTKSHFSVRSIEQLADLLANPTETVEDDT